MKAFTRLFALAALILAASCESQVLQEQNLVLDSAEDKNIVLDPSGEERNIAFTSARSWVVNIEAGSTWLELSQMNGVAGSNVLTVKAAPNTGTKTRTGHLRIVSSGESVDIHLEQAPDPDFKFSLSSQMFEVPAEGGTIEIQVEASVEYKFDILDDWITEVETKAVKTHVLNVAENTATEERIGTVTFCVDQQCIPVSVVQAAAENNGENPGEGGENPGEGGENPGEGGENPGEGGENPGEGGENPGEGGENPGEGGENPGEGGENPGGGDDSGNGVDPDAKFVHRSLGMRFTATWCGYCPIMAESFDMAYEKLDGMIELVSVHGYGSSLVFNGGGPLENRFKIEGFPTGHVDSRGVIENYESAYASSMIKSVSEETVEHYPTNTGIGVSSTLSGNNLSVDVTVHVKEADDYKIAVMLLEDDIIASQSGAGSNYEHDNVLRMSLTNVLGDSMTVTEDNSVWTKNYTATIPTKCNTDNMRVLVYVEKPYGDRSKVSGVAYVLYDNYGTTYVDNARSVAIGTTAEVEYE